MNRALEYAHAKGVTLVAALGNEHTRTLEPAARRHEPRLPGRHRAPAHDRQLELPRLPVEGPHVIGVSSLGPSEKKADYSNYATDLTSGELEVSAPGGWFRDGFGTPTYRTNGNLILSTAPLNVMQEEGQVDADGNITDSAPRWARRSRAARSRARRSAGTTSTSRARRWRHRTPPASPRWRSRRTASRRAGRASAWLPTRSRRCSWARRPTTPARRRRCRATPQEGRPASFDALCTGTADFNSLLR